jgi:hypothetical protein
MSDPLTDRLAHFTPDASGLDRDALLFDAGRASARPDRRWKAIVGLLVVCQVLTLAWLGAQASSAPLAGLTPQPRRERSPAPVLDRPPGRSPPGLTPSGSPVGPPLVRRWPADDTELPPPVPAEGLIPDAPPLRAFTVGAHMPVD